MRVFAYKSPTAVKILQSREFPWFNDYFRDFAIQGDVLFAFGNYHENADPLKDAFDDYCFNEPEESKKLFAKYERIERRTLILTWYPQFGEDE